MSIMVYGDLVAYIAIETVKDMAATDWRVKRQRRCAGLGFKRTVLQFAYRTATLQ